MPLSTFFTGRTRELLELTRQVGGAGVLICGLGGMGKAALARALVRTLAPRYPDLQIAIDLQGTSPEPLSPAAAMARVVRAFLPCVALPSSPEDLAGLYRALLEGQRALIFLEDARDRAQVEPLLAPVGSALVVTSRRRFALPGVYALSLDRLDAPDAVALLQRCEPALDDATASEIAELCGGVPLALRLAGGALYSRPDLPPQVYVARLRDAQSRHELLDAALQVSFSLLDPILQVVWPRVGLLPPASSAEVWFSGLVEYGLLEHNPETELHTTPRSARRLARSHLTEVERAEAERRIVEVTPNEAHLGAQNAELMHGAKLEHALGAARRAGYRPAEALYLERMAANLGDHPPAAELTAQALAICRELDDRSGERRMLNKLALLEARSKTRHRDASLGEQAATLLRELAHPVDDRRAALLQEQRLANARERGSRGDQARSAWQLSVIYRRLGDLDQALAALELCCDLVEAIGWGSLTASAALGRSEAGSLTDELKRLRASRAK